MTEIWREPVRGGFMHPSAFALPGIERIQAMYRGLLPVPPITHLSGMRITQVGAGSVTLSMPASAWLMGFQGWIHPALAIQAAMTGAVVTTLPAGRIAIPRVLSLNHARAASEDSVAIVARAHVLHTRRTIALVDATAEDADGRLLAHASGNIATPEMEPPPPPPPPELTHVGEPSYPTLDPYLRPLPKDVYRAGMEEEMSGLEMIKAFLSGDLPPIPGTLLFGWRPVDVAEGRVIYSVPSSEWLCNSAGRVEEGVISTCLAGVLLAAIQTTQPADQALGVLSLDAKFLRPVFPVGEDLQFRAAVSYRRESLIVANAEVIDGEGNQVALGSTTAIPVALTPKRSPAKHRELATVLFTDIVGSTSLSERLGDNRWRTVLDEHDRLVRKELANFGGREVKTMGDGFLATFDSPARALQCARVICEGVRRLDIEIRAGVHTGEVEMTEGDVGGIAVSIARRVVDAAEPGEVLVSSTVRDLVAGSGIPFEDRGAKTLKGIPEPWRLFAVGSG